jgi:type II secretory pathway component PulJ
MKNQKGFTHIEVLLIVLVLVGVGGLIAWRVLDSQTSQSNAAQVNN